MSDRILTRLSAAARGRRLWRRLCRDYDVESGAYVVLMVEDDPELNEIALRRLGDLVADRTARGVVVVTDRPGVAAAARASDAPILGVVEVTAHEADGLVSLLELTPFSPRLLVIAWSRPYGSDLRAAVGVHGVTVEDVVCLCMLLIRGWSGAEGLCRG
jgi:hypothetical protein